MILRDEENEKMMSLYMEAPQMGADISGIASHIDDKTFIDDIRNRGIHRAKLPYGDVYIVGMGPKNFVICVIDNDAMVVYYNFKYITNDYIQTKVIRGSENLPGVFRHFFLNYVLPTFTTVEGDVILSVLGFKFWKRLYNETNLNFYVINLITNSVETVTNIKQFDKYYGPDKSFRNFKYVVSRINRPEAELLRLATTEVVGD